jgi:hypothetical protein
MLPGGLIIKFKWHFISVSKLVTKKVANLGLVQYFAICNLGKVWQPSWMSGGTGHQQEPSSSHPQ